MTVIADITVSADTFALGSILEDVQDVDIELERIVPLQQNIIPLFWISGGDQDVIESRLREFPQTKSVKSLTTTDGRTLYEVHWSREINGFVQALIDTRAKILEAEGTAETWDFRLRFSDHEDLSEFNMALTEHDIPVTLRHIYNPTIPEEGTSLSSDQRETLLEAYRNGYFDVPRENNLSELADTMDISDSALSQRLRRGTETLIEQSLLDGEQTGQ